MDDFKVKFRGVRGSFPKADKNFIRYGGNTACVELNVGSQVIILDAGTGIVSAGDDLLEQHITSSFNKEDRIPVQAHIFLSHIHLDHLLGLTFFKPLHLKNSKINVFGMGSENKSTLSSDLSQYIFGKTFPLDLGDIACDLNLIDLSEDVVIIIDKDGSYSLINQNDLPSIKSDVITVSFYKSYVHPQDGVIIFKIEYAGKSLVYATDKECYFGGDKKFIKFAKNCDLLIHDTQYTTEDYLNPNSPKQGFGHSTFDMAVETLKQTGAKKMAFFHYDPEYNDEKLDRINALYSSSNSNIIMSYDGLELNL